MILSRTSAFPLRLLIAVIAAAVALLIAAAAAAQASDCDFSGKTVALPSIMRVELKW
jgi:hypothetical protein